MGKRSKQKEELSFPNIGRTQLVVFGMPRVLGTRLTVYDLVDDLSFQSIQKVCEHRELEFEVAVEALTYCAGQYCGDNREDTFCNQCSKSQLDSQSNEQLPNGWEVAARLLKSLDDCDGIADVQR